MSDGWQNKNQLLERKTEQFELQLCTQQNIVLKYKKIK